MGEVFSVRASASSGMRSKYGRRASGVDTSTVFGPLTTVPSSARHEPSGITTLRVFTPPSTTGATSRSSPIMNWSSTSS